MIRTVEIRRKRRQWRAWVKRIHRELNYQNVSRRTFEEVGKIVRANDNIQKPVHFHDWLSRNYGLTSAATVRLLTDNRSDSLSLVRLLKEISKDPCVVSRRTFVSRYQKSMRSFAHQKFDQLTGNPSAPFLSKKTVDKDLQELLTVSVRLRKFVNKRLAHLDQKNTLRKLPTFKDLHFVMTTLERIGSKYRFLLTASTTQDEPLPPNWDTIFFEPWKSDS